MTGTLWHGWAHEALVRTGMPFMQEVKLDRWLPEGWSGTADWVFWNADLGGFVLGDMKTMVVWDKVGTTSRTPHHPQNRERPRFQDLSE